MASSLAGQLFRMRNIDRVISSERSQKIRASFLFDGRQAADIDMQTIFDIGCDGLGELRKMNRKFDSFASTLFSPAIKDLDRVLQTREENERLDESIRSFLFLMAPYFLTKPAGKALEWLIRRLRIQEFNTRDLLAAILPYHETKAFLTMLTIITFETRDMELFGFLVTQRKARRLLDRGTLMAQCVRDRALMTFVCSSVFRACQMGFGYAGLHAFYAMIFSQYITSLTSVGGADVQFVLPFVLDGLQLDGDAQIAAYMVLGTLATRVTLSADALDKTLCAVAQRPADLRAMMMCVVQLVQTQEAALTAGLSLRFVRALHAHAEFPRVLCALAGDYDVSLFMAPLLAALAHHAFDDAEALQLLSAFVPLLPGAHIPVLCTQLVREYVARGDSGNLTAVLDLLQLRHSQQLEDAIGACAVDADESTHRLLYQLKIRGSQDNASRVLPLQETSTTLYLSIGHADAGMRLVAANALRDIVSGKGGEYSLSTEDACDLIVGRLEHEDNEQVLDIVLGLPLSEYVPAAKLIVLLAQLISRVSKEQLTDKIVARLLETDASSEELQTQIAGAVFLFVLQFTGTQDVTKALATRVKKSTASAGWLAAIGKYANASSPGKYNKQAATALGSALANQWEQLSNAKTGAWAAQLQRTASVPARTAAVAVGVQAVLKLAAAKNAARCVSAAKSVIDAALDIVSSLGSAHVSDDVALTTADSAQWDQLLNGLAQDSRDIACARVAVGSISAVLGLLPAVVSLQPGQWFTTVQGDAELAYCDLVRTMFVTTVARSGETGSVDGVLTGRLLHECVGSDWAQFLAATWLADVGPMVRARSLLALRALIPQQPSALDLQTILPAVVAMLGDDDERVRSAAATCVRQLKQAYPHSPAKDAEQDIYMYDAFYGATSDRLQYLPLQTVVRLVAQLAMHADAMIADADVAALELGAIVSRGTGSLGGKPTKLSSQARESVVAFLLSHVVAADGVVPQLQTRLLGVMRAVVTGSVLEQLLPLLNSHVDELKTQSLPEAGSTEDMLIHTLFRTCYAPSMAPQLANTKQAWPAFLEFLSGANGVPEAWGPAERAQAYVQQLSFGQLAQGFTDGLGSEAVAQITSCLIRVAVRGNAYVMAGGVSLRDLFSRMQLDAVTAADEISAIAGRLGDGENKSKKARAASEPSELPELATLLEYVQNSSVGTDTALVPALVSLLSVFVGADAGRHGTQAYVMQLVLGMLTRVFEAATAAHVVVPESVVRVDTIVQAIRTSSSPQTHNQTLLLLAAVAAQHPDVVLHHVMAIFTFMGANVLRQDDEYSFHVIQQTLERVIPPLVQHGGSRAEQIAQAGPVLRVFVDTLTHIPRHRRMALFSTLVRTMGADSYAAAVVELLLEKNVARVLKGGRETDDVLAFTLSLTHELEAVQQLQCVEQVLLDVAALPADSVKNTESAAGIVQYADVARMSGGELRTFRLVVLDYAHQLLTSRQFGSKLGALQGAADAQLSRTAQTQLQLIAQLSAQHAQVEAGGLLDTDVAARAWKQTVQLAYAVLDDVNALMRLQLFVSTVVQLLGHDDLKVRRKALALANTRLSEVDARTADADDVLELLAPVAAVAAAELDTSDERESLACKQAALLCVATAARRFAAARPTQFTDLVAIISGVHSLGAAHAAVASAAMVALAVLCDQLGPRLIPMLPTYLPLVLKHLRAATAQLETAAADDLALLISALSSMLAIVENMGAFLAPSLAPLLLCLLSPALRSEGDHAELRTQAQQKADEVLVAMANNVPARQLLPAQFAFYQREAVRQGAATAELAVAFVGRTAAALPRAQLMQNYKQLFKFFLSVFDAARNPGVELGAAQALEQATLDAFMRLVVRLSEALFRPLFLTFAEWAAASAPVPAVAWATKKDAGRSQHAEETRLRVFYRALNELYEKLRSILTPYYVQVMDTTVTQLKRFGVSHASIEAQEEADRHEKAAPSALWTAVLESVRLSSLHDTASELWTEDACRRVFSPLADQLPNTKPVAGENSDDAYDAYISRVRDTLAPAASQLLATAGNDAMWKMLNQFVMLKSRSEYACVRHGALLVLQACYEKLGEEYLILLPETIPYLAELLEDDDSRVERATHETIRLIESYLGESLQSYLR
ncbi:snoRNA-binding rRNA-processing protein utp10 [Coemansia sp. RSA 1853]|nr:snoRNA-binding rRNA-processing protein utp10 [Coemansia sp. RSA 1853]